MLKPIAGGVILSLLCFSPVVAQTQVQPLRPQILSQGFTPRSSSQSVSPLELQQFAQALRQLRRVEMETQEKMAAALKDEKLSPERFQEIGRQRNDPDFPVTTEVTQSEQQRFDKALARIQTIQQEAAPKQNRAITLQGLTVERFNQIAQVVDRNPTLRQQLQNSF